MSQISVFRKSRKFLDRLSMTFGKKLIIFLTVVFFIQEGFIFSLIQLNQLPYYKDVLHISETRYQVFFLIAWSPWSMKAFFGGISDLYPLFGFNKCSYILFTGLFGTAALAVLAFVNIEPNMAVMAPSMIFVVMVELSVMDLLCEGTYSKILFEKKIKRGDIISWVWICRVLGQLIAGSIIGVLVDKHHPRNIYLICFIASFPCLFLLLLGFMGERYITRWYAKFAYNKLRSQWRLFGLAFILVLANVGMIVVNLHAETHPTIMLIYLITSSVILFILAFLLLPRPLANCNLYIFLQEALYFRIMGALDYWYTADNSCVPGGPHFDMTFYLTITQVISCISGVIGILVFHNFTQNWSFQFAFLFSVLIRAVGSLFDLFIVSRTNIKIGLSDKLTLVFGDAIIIDIAYYMAKMPAVLLTARLIHRGYESTIYAILSGYHDFGKAVSTSLGTMLMVFYGIKFKPKSCEYDNLGNLILVCHLLMPLLAIPFIYFLIPNVRLSDVTAFDDFKADSQYGDFQHFEDEDIDISSESEDNSKQRRVIGVPEESKT